MLIFCVEVEKLYLNHISLNIKYLTLKFISVGWLLIMFIFYKNQSP